MAWRVSRHQGGERTAALIPLLPYACVTRVDIAFTSDARLPRWCVATVENVGRTGVEMEAMTAVAVALLTIYDMCKAADRGMHCESIRLLEKKGGKSGHWRAGAD